MKNKQNKFITWLKVNYLQLIGILSPFLYTQFKRIPAWNSLIIEKAKTIGLPASTLNMLILLSLFVILTLVLSIRSILRKDKTVVIRANIPDEIESLPVIEEDKLPEQMADIVKLLQNNNHLFPHEIKSKLSFTDDELSHYTRELWLEEDYITQERFFSNRVPSHLMDPKYAFKWKLTNKGIAYLIKNHL